MTRPSGRAATIAIGALVAVSLAVSGCSSTGVASDGEVTALNTPTPPPATLSAADVKAIVKRRAPAIESAVRRFRACDQAAGDSYAAAPCLSKVAAESAAAAALLGDLGSIDLPPGYEATVKDLKDLSRSAARVVLKCGQVNDQVCDQALAKFRANEQSVLWDLDLNP